MLVTREIGFQIPPFPGKVEDLPVPDSENPRFPIRPGAGIGVTGAAGRGFPQAGLRVGVPTPGPTSPRCQEMAQAAATCGHGHAAPSDADAAQVPLNL